MLMTHEECEIEFERLHAELDQLRGTPGSEEGCLLLGEQVRQLRVEQAKLPLPTLPIDSLGDL